MVRRKAFLSVIAAMAITVFSVAAAAAQPDEAAVDKSCTAAVGPALERSGGALTADVRAAYVDWAEKSVVQALRADHAAVPAECLAEVGSHPNVRDALFAGVYPPDPSVLQNYAELRAQLPADVLEKYRSLVIGVAVSRRTHGVESAEQQKTIGQDYQAGFWGAIRS